MTETGRTSVEIMESHVLIVGLLRTGKNVYGPFNNALEATEYGGKNFPDETREVLKMTREVVTCE